MTLQGNFTPLSRAELRSNRPAPDDDLTPVLPVPEDAPPLGKFLISRFAPEGATISRGWRYLDDAGHLLCFVIRYDGPAGKAIKPFGFFRNSNGIESWHCHALPAPRPLFGLDRLATRPDAPVLVVEGEKTVDGACERFPDHVAITSMGGSNGAAKADWSPLAGRRVIVWPDADRPGSEYATNVSRLVADAGAASVRVVKLPIDLPVAWDLADEPPDGVSGADLAKWLADAEVVGGWAAPVPIGSSLPSVDAFDPEMLPEALRLYVLDVADRQQSSPDYVAVTTLCGLAAMVGNRVRIAPKSEDDWTVAPNLWGALIGPPSAMKSPAMTSALASVYAIEDEMRAAWQASIEDAELNDVLSSLDEREAKKQAAKALKSGNRDAARAALAEIGNNDDEPPPCPRVVVNDATVEKLGELLNENPRGLLLIRDELPGWLARMEREEFAGERAFYLEAFNGCGRFVYDRIGRGTVHIRNVTLSLVGGVQPSRVAPIVRGAITGTMNDGLIQRLQLAVWPDQRPTWTWVDRHPDKSARDAYEKAFRDMHDFPLGSPDEPLVLRFSPEAQTLFRTWMEEIQIEARSGKLSPVLESHLLKMPKTVASLALLFELIDGGKFDVGRTATLRALAWADYLRSHARRLYASGGTMIEDGARLIIERRKQLPEKFVARDLQRKGWAGLVDADAITDALELLIKTHHCREVSRPSTAAGGRPTMAYEWNPALMEGR